MRLIIGLLVASSLAAQDNPDAHIAAAKLAAGDDFQNLFNFQCYGPGPGGPRAAAEAQYTHGQLQGREPPVRGRQALPTDPPGMPNQ